MKRLPGTLRLLYSLRDHGPQTSRRLATRLRAPNLNLLRARLTELCHAGAIVRDGTVRCAVSGRQVTLWRFVPPDQRRGYSTPTRPEFMYAIAHEAIDHLGGCGCAINAKLSEDYFKELDEAAGWKRPGPLP